MPNRTPFAAAVPLPHSRYGLCAARHGSILLRQNSCGIPGGKNREVNPYERRETHVYRLFGELLFVFEGHGTKLCQACLPFLCAWGIIIVDSRGEVLVTVPVHIISLSCIISTFSLYLCQALWTSHSFVYCLILCWIDAFEPQPIWITGTLHEVRMYCSRPSLQGYSNRTGVVSSL